MNQPFLESYCRLQNGITIFPSHDRAIDQVLTDLVSQVPAHFVLLTDTTGQLISAQGNRGKIDLVALGVLMAGELAASQEVARLTGEHQDYQMIMREGQRSHIFISGAGRHLALLTKVSHDVPLGWVRMLVKRAARSLADIIAMPPEEAESSDLVLSQDDKKGLPDLIGDALKNLWLE
jgi:predicted regulator of Ras-like GTPase activity (Roadblock/LC7/MglB family)